MCCLSTRPLRLESVIPSTVVTARTQLGPPMGLDPLRISRLAISPPHTCRCSPLGSHRWWCLSLTLQYTVGGCMCCIGIGSIGDGTDRLPWTWSIDRSYWTARRPAPMPAAVADTFVGSECSSTHGHVLTATSSRDACGDGGSLNLPHHDLHMRRHEYPVSA